MSAEQNQPDWGRIAGKFDLWLPQIEPVGEALLEVLDARPGHAVLDLASGTGEPALTLARRLPDIRIEGIDAAEGMVEAARAKVTQEGLGNIRFQTMAAEALAFPDEHFDRVLCRFGVMLFDDPARGLAEMRRVLKGDGRFAIAVWSTPETMPTLCWSWQAFKGRVPEDFHPPLPKVTSLGAPGVLESLLQEAGFADFRVEKKTLHYRFESFEDYWDTVEASEILRRQYEALPEDQHGLIREEIREMAEEHLCEEGLVIPHEYLLAWGGRN